MDGMCFHWDNRNTLKHTICSTCTFSHFTRCVHSKLNEMHMVIYFVYFSAVRTGQESIKYVLIAFHVCLFVAFLILVTYVKLQWNIYMSQRWTFKTLAMRDGIWVAWHCKLISAVSKGMWCSCKVQTWQGDINLQTVLIFLTNVNQWLQAYTMQRVQCQLCGAWQPHVFYQPFCLQSKVSIKP